METQKSLSVDAPHICSITHLDSADTLPPGTPFQSRANMPIYNIDIKANGTTYDDRKNDI